MLNHHLCSAWVNYCGVALEGFFEISEYCLGVELYTFVLLHLTSSHVKVQTYAHTVGNRRFSSVDREHGLNALEEFGFVEFGRIWALFHLLLDHSAEESTDVVVQRVAGAFRLYFATTIVAAHCAEHNSYERKDREFFHDYKYEF